MSSQGLCLTHIVFSRILYKFPSKARVLFPFQVSFENLESGTIRVDPYCRFRKNRSTFIKNTYGLLLNFFNNSRKLWPRGNTVWLLLPFQGSHILSFPGSNKNFNLKLIYFLVFKSFLKKIVSRTIRFDSYCPFKDLTKISTLAPIFFRVQTFIKKSASGILRFDPYYPSQDLIKISTKNSYCF